MRLYSLSLFALLMFAMESSADTNSGGVQHLLTLGNRHFVLSRPLHPRQSRERRNEIVREQHPVAAVLSCADSRVPPELVFDMGLGDFFVVRVAGNIVNDDILGSLEYAVEHLHLGVIVVLGHTSCGAVNAAVTGKLTHTHIDSIIDAIAPAVEKARAVGGDLERNSERANVLQSVEALKSDTSILAAAMKAGKLQVVGAIYDLKTGKVSWVH